MRSAGVLGVAIDAAGARAIADRARGTPRVANRLLKRVRDFAEVRSDGAVDATVAGAALDLMGVDQIGLDRTDREILDDRLRALLRRPGRALDARRRGRGRRRTRSRTSTSRTCSSAASCSARPRGRCATVHAFRHLGLEPPAEPSALF